jgi:hypothetical protein
MDKMSSKTNVINYYVEGPDWSQTVEIDTDIFNDKRSQLFEAGSRAIELEMKKTENFNLGAILIVKPTKKSQKEALVNAYICLLNVGQYAMAENLRTNFKKSSGQDLGIDQIGYTEE